MTSWNEYKGCPLHKTTRKDFTYKVTLCGHFNYKYEDIKKYFIGL